jgi:hypothetical protein
VTNLRTLPDAILKYLTLYTQHIGTPVGFRALTESGPDCQGGCLAPGSSPHSHSIVTAWELIGTTGILTVDPQGNCVRDSTVHPFPVSA